MNFVPETTESRLEFTHANWWVLITAAGWLVFAAFTMAFPLLGGRIAYAAQWASIAVGMLLLLAILLAAERPRWSLPVRIAMFAGGVGFVLLCWLMNWHGSPLKPLIALALMGLAVPVGYWIGERMEKITNLIPLAIAMSLADIYSVFQGPTKVIADKLIEHHDKVARIVANEAPQVAAQKIAALKAPLADYIVVHFPIVGTQGTVPILGMGDFIVLAFLFRAAWVHHVSPRLVFTAAAGSIFVALFCTNVLGMALPALPFIAIGTIAVLFLAVPRVRQLDRQEVVLSFGVVGVFGALITGKYLTALL
jgi:hypothetical protein